MSEQVETEQEQPVETPPETPPAAVEETPEDDFDKERALATIRAQREAEKAAKDRIKELEAQAAELQAIKDAEKTELEREREARERLEAENAAKDARLRDANLRTALADTKYGIADPEIAATLLKGEVAFDDDGNPQDLDQVVESLLERKPLLKAGAAATRTAPPSIDAGAGQGNGPEPALTAEELDMAKRLGQDPRLYAELKRVSNENGGVIDYEAYQAAVERANAQG